MSNSPDNQFGLSNLSARVGNWLRSIAARQPSQADGAVMPVHLPTSDLLQRAARCYGTAGWTDEACRLYENLGDDRQAAHYHEQQGRWEPAARCYARAGEWQGAARCHLQDQRPAEAAECLLNAKQTLQAAWVLADLAHSFPRATYIARQVAAESDTERLGVELVLARCEAGTGAVAEAARRLRRVIAQLRVQSVELRRQHLTEWAFTIAQTLRRPDLTAALHAASVAAGALRAREQWEQWALAALNDTTGIPQQDNERQSSQPGTAE